MDADLDTKLSALSEISRLKLSAILNTVKGTKDLTIEPKLIRPLDRVCGAKWLRRNDVDKIFKLEDRTPARSVNAQVYAVSSEPRPFERALDQIRSSLNSEETEEEAAAKGSAGRAEAKYHVLVVPRVLDRHERLLEELGLYGLARLHSYAWELIRLDRKVFSLELDGLFADAFVRSECALLVPVARSLSNALFVTGRAERTVVVGKRAESVWELCEGFASELGEPVRRSDSELGVLIVMDRSTDYASALLTCVTYGGLLAEALDVSCGRAEFRGESGSGFALDGTADATYEDIKHRHIAEATDVLSESARRLKQERSDRDPKTMGVDELKSYVRTELGAAASQASRTVLNHLRACERIVESFGGKFEKYQATEQAIVANASRSANLGVVEELVLRGDGEIALRLACLASRFQRATRDELDGLKLKYLQAFGYDRLHEWEGLVSSGLLCEPTSGGWLGRAGGGGKRDVYAAMKLVPGREQDARCPTCPSYVFGGSFHPLAARLAEIAIQSRSESELRSKLEPLGPERIECGGGGGGKGSVKRTALVFVVGGITAAELSALAFVEKACSGCSIVGAGCHVTSGNDLLREAMMMTKSKRT